jgi:hypothetical protein
MANYTQAQLIAPTFLQGVATVMYQVPYLTSTQITACSINNTDQTSAHTVHIYVSEGTGNPLHNELIQKINLQAGQQYLVYILSNQILDSLQTIQAYADAPNVITMMASGIQIV